MGIFSDARDQLEHERQGLQQAAIEENEVMLEAAHVMREASARIATLDADKAALLEALKDFVDDEKCRYDHHGYCQTHGPRDIPCHMQIARRAVAQAEGR